MQGAATRWCQKKKGKKRGGTAGGPPFTKKGGVLDGKRAGGGMYSHVKSETKESLRGPFERCGFGPKRKQ